MQTRTLVTRAKLLQVAQALVADGGYGALRVDEVVKEAGVAKGTFFAHFRDKDALMDHLIGGQIDLLIDQATVHPAPNNVDDLVTCLTPLMVFMTSERYVFDIILRHSGAAAKDEIGAIAQTFARQVNLMSDWVAGGPFRTDVPARLLADGIQAFLIHCIGLQFCAAHQGAPMDQRLRHFLDAWLSPIARSP
ncbi:TetR/AcrR family transcriptional regulator [Gymnodinialimonas sp. 2305UL16-5]|uniref:TetR/AcrR family transcriptional regulator n=1 Tax=Gymnodinialimonas mytili TaxID=3126503 RepID=UPI0030983D41